ncbi:MAG: Hypothetical protein LKU_02383 [Lactobacillus kefiranofaciens]|nr:hypothetical protein WANG_1489 [Lactobacillus kefiranofaciens subsp. kefiranofaciens]
MLFVNLGYFDEKELNLMDKQTNQQQYHHDPNSIEQIN